MKRYDAIVIGGGLVGSAIAYGLAREGLQTALVDEGDVAFRAVVHVVGARGVGVFTALDTVGADVEVNRDGRGVERSDPPIERVILILDDPTARVLHGEPVVVVVKGGGNGAHGAGDDLLGFTRDVAERVVGRRGRITERIENARDVPEAVVRVPRHRSLDVRRRRRPEVLAFLDGGDAPDGVAVAPVDVAFRESSIWFSVLAL